MIAAHNANNERSHKLSMYYAWHQARWVRPEYQAPSLALALGEEKRKMGPEQIAANLRSWVSATRHLKAA